MIERYTNPEIEEICSDKAKVDRWQEVELAVIEAKSLLGRIPQTVFRKIREAFRRTPVDLEKWAEIEKSNDHDLAAFITERKSHLPKELEGYIHAENMTSYDTEEPAFAMMLLQCLGCVFFKIDTLTRVLSVMAEKYRYTIMNGRTHGQEAEIETQGKRCLSWLAPILETRNLLCYLTKERLMKSKLSGAIGNYSGIDPELEKKALSFLGLFPYVGATQIIPRTHYMPLVSALNELMGNINKIATDIRLGARSGRPIYQEPFKTTQVGSSAMPQKKNSTKTENNGGMKMMSGGYLVMLEQTMVTWEERAIEQSCVERVAWPDLFHVVMHALKTITKVLDGLQVFPDNMLLEIVESRGCYAASHAKQVLADLLLPQGLETKDVYRIVQLACFNVFEHSSQRKQVRGTLATSFDQANTLLDKVLTLKPEKIVSIQDFIPNGELRVSPELAATRLEVKKWNKALREVFTTKDAIDKWNLIFDPKYLLRNEDYIFKTVLDGLT